MKRFWVILMVLALVSPAVAQSKVSIKGHYEITGLAGEIVNAQNNRVDSTGDEDKRAYLAILWASFKLNRIKSSIAVIPTNMIKNLSASGTQSSPINPYPRDTFMATECCIDQGSCYDHKLNAPKNRRLDSGKRSELNVLS